MDIENWYGLGAVITGGLTFVIVWLYAMGAWGVLIGLMFGWIPAVIAGIVAGALWPLMACLIGIYILLLIGIYL